MEDILDKYPDLDAFIPTGGFPQFLPDAYETTAEKFKDKIASRQHSRSWSPTRCRSRST